MRLRSFPRLKQREARVLYIDIHALHRYPSPHSLRVASEFVKARHLERWCSCLAGATLDDPPFRAFQRNQTKKLFQAGLPLLLGISLEIQRFGAAGRIGEKITKHQETESLVQLPPPKRAFGKDDSELFQRRALNQLLGLIGLRLVIARDPSVQCTVGQRSIAVWVHSMRRFAILGAFNTCCF